MDEFEDEQIIQTRKNVLTQGDYKNIAIELKKVVLEEGCPLKNTQDREAVLHLYGLFRDYGEGDISKGIRKFRILINFVDSVQSKKNLAIGASFTIVVATLIGWAIKITVVGVFEYLRTGLVK